LFILLPEFSFSLVVDPVIEPFVDPIVVVDAVVVFGKMIEMTFKLKPSSGTIVDPIFDVSACVKKSFILYSKPFEQTRITNNSVEDFLR